MASNSYRKQFNKIRAEVGKIGNDFAKGLAIQAVEDLSEVHTDIVNQYYDAYDPQRYNRSYGLYNSAIPQPPIHTSSKTYVAGIVVGSYMMESYYRISPDNVFDLFWNNGVRGLPETGSKANDNGDVWINPYWDVSTYHNIFKTNSKLGSYTSVTGTPHEIMEDITLHWGIASGKKTCDRLYNEIKKKYQ